MTTKIFTDRSRIIDFQRCNRKRWLTYHQDSTGIVPARMPLPLAVGLAVHSGLEVLLREGQRHIDRYIASAVPPSDYEGLLANSQMEDSAVAAALSEFQQFASALDLDATESAAMQPTLAADVFQQQVVAQARELGMDEAAVAGLARDPAVARSEFDRYLAAEQAALVEGMVRAYARRRLQPLLSQFEVLEVEREGEWKLSEWPGHHILDRGECIHCHVHMDHVIRLGKNLEEWMRGDCPCNTTELWFMSRPDALLRERQSNELYLLSYKTTATWDVRKARDIEHDMQGLSEGVEVERRLGEWWQVLHANTGQAELREKGGLLWKDLTIPIENFLRSCPAPPRIHAIRYEFLLKGYRAEDKELSARLGITAWTQRSHLVRQYVATSVPKKGDGGYRVGDVCWSWEFYRPEDDKDSKLAWQNWHSRPVWDDVVTEWADASKTMEAWIDALDASELLMSGEDSTVGLQPRVLGWKSPAQAMGVTKEHPLDEVFVPPVTIWRSDDDLRDWVESVEAQERKIAEAVALVQASTDPGERRSLLNIHFPMVRTACEFPTQCPFAHPRTGVCYAGAEMKNDPLRVGDGAYKRRVPNHPAELVNIK
jgi:hypothetical protein